MVSFAALATILILAFQTFIQQTLRTEERLVEIGDQVAKLTSAKTYKTNAVAYKGNIVTEPRAQPWSRISCR
jgi:hypothetical protein